MNKNNTIARGGYLNHIKEKISKYKYVCIFPMGIAGKAMLDKLQEMEINVDFFSDNNERKTEDFFKGKKCISVEELCMKYKDNTTIIVESLYYKEIKSGLLARGLNNIIRIYPNKLEIEDYLENNKDSLQDNICWLCEQLEDEESKEIVEHITKSWLDLDVQDNYFEKIYSKKQYFDNRILQFTSNESFVDCGAYTGDSMLEFLKTIKNQFGEMHLFELDKGIFTLLKSNVENLQLSSDRMSKIHCYPFGVSDLNTQIYYNSGDSSSSINTLGEIPGEVVALDEKLSDKAVTFIKMDIEGAEFEALHGAERIIKEQKPKLAICIYHSAEDMFRIPQYIKSLVPEYKIYIRHYTDMMYETVCYATL